MFAFLAEREGFEPPIPVKVCLISSQVHSTALPSLRAFVINNLTIPLSSRFVHCDKICDIFLPLFPLATIFR